ncbi:MAG: NAD(P)H-dependent oxidoreductase [Gammaproteobacteria bacterium]
MTTLLQLNTSLFGESGQSSRLADEFVAKWKDSQPDARIIRRDFAVDPIPHLTAERINAIAVPATQRNPVQARDAAIADELIMELSAADVLVIGTPMYNFGVPTTLKAWFDHVARAGTTFRYSANGPEGLMKNKKAYLFMTRGGKYAGTESDLQTPYIRQFLGFIGITDIEFIYAEGLAMGNDVGQKALAAANARILALAA